MSVAVEQQATRQKVATLRDQADDASAEFDRFYRATSRELLGQLCLMCGSRPAAEECLQEAYLRAWQRWDAISKYERPDAWVRTVAWRLAVGRWRRARTALKHLTEPRAVETSSAEMDGDGAAIMSALLRLSHVQRQAVVLHHVEELSVEEIANLLGTSIGTVKTRLRRGRTTLIQLLGEENAP